jgi:glutamate carboxypeptidase
MSPPRSTPTVAELRDALDAAWPLALDVLERVVRINSFTRNREGVVANGEIFEALFLPLGFAARRIAAGAPDLGDHLLLERCVAGGPEVVLVSHLDTVYPPEEEARHAFHWREAGERIHGPGVADIKGGTVMAWLVVRALHDAAPELFARTTWRVALNAAEEEGNDTFPPLLRGLLGAATRACLVFECSNELEGGANTLAVARRGAARFRIEVRGRSAHAGSGHAHGANAIREAARLVESLESMSRPERGLTFNVGRIAGGEVVNTVPDRAALWLDVRAQTPEDYETASRTVESVAGEGSVRARSDGYPCSIEVHRLAGYPPWPENGGSEAIARAFAEVADELALRHVLEHRHGASDGNHAWDLAPTIDGLGPAGSDLHSSAHDPAAGKRQESVRRSSFVERGLMTARTLTRLLG